MIYEKVMLTDARYDHMFESDIIKYEKEIIDSLIAQYKEEGLEDEVINLRIVEYLSYKKLRTVNVIGQRAIEKLIDEYLKK